MHTNPVNCVTCTHSMNGLDRQSRLYRIGRWVVVGLVVLSLCAAALYWWIGPSLADARIRDRLSRLTDDTSMTVNYDRLAAQGLDALTLDGLRLGFEGSGDPTFRADTVTLRLRWWSLLVGEPEISSIAVEGARGRIHVGPPPHATNLHALLAALRDRGSADTAESDNDDPDDATRLRAPLGRFGGHWPNLQLRDGSLQVQLPGAPFDRVSEVDLSIDSHGESAALNAEVALAGAAPDSGWVVPERVTVEGTLRRALASSTGSVTFSPTLEVVGLPPYDFVRLGLDRVLVEPQQRITVIGMRAGLQDDGPPTWVGRSDRASIQFLEWPTSVDEADIQRLEIDSPSVELTVGPDGESALSDLVQLVTNPAAHRVRNRARAIASRLGSDEGERKGSSADGDARGVDDDGVDKRSGPVRRILFDPRMPDRIDITDASVTLKDIIQWDLERPAHTWQLKDGRLAVQHRPARGILSIEGGFDASALPGPSGSDSASNRGRASWDLDANYRSPRLTGTAEITSLDLSWLARLGGQSVAQRLKGGELELSLKNRLQDETQTFQGQVALKGLNLALPALAEDPIDDLSAAYSFAGTFDPNASPPDPTLFPKEELTSSSANGTSDREAAANPQGVDRQEGDRQTPSIPERGILRVHDGKVNVNGVKATFRPALFGIDGLARRPARLDADVKIPETDVQTLFEAVPASIRGPLNGTKMRGTFQWEFHGEFPLYNAGETEWTSKPTLRGFRLVELPEAVDVRELTGSFTHTIANPDETFKRTIRIPAMRPVPLDWLTSHLGAEPEALKQRRERRGWPGPDAPALPVPQPWGDRQPLSSTDKLDVPPETSRLDWGRHLADQRLAPGGPATLRTRAAPPEPVSPEPEAPTASETPETPDAAPSLRPWDQSVLTTGRRRAQLHRYGPYIYTPLQHISPWLPRAIRTTEDNSFFEHHGFNWFALKASLEDNLEAGGFVRGGSTISMQLVKNLYLSFDKVLARKLREAFLVWLMEDIVDVPKARILEVYFNIIEFGPGIFGIHDGAAHYFGKRPDELTLGEVSWLVSIIPNPREYHRYYRRGKLTPGWLATVTRYVEIMADRDRAAKHDAQRVKSNPPTFYKPGPDEPVLRPEISRPVLPGDTPSSAPASSDTSSAAAPSETAPDETE